MRWSVICIEKNAQEVAGHVAERGRTRRECGPFLPFLFSFPYHFAQRPPEERRPATPSPLPTLAQPSPPTRVMAAPPRPGKVGAKPWLKGQVDDLASLANLDDAILLEELRTRYTENKIYVRMMKWPRGEVGEGGGE